MSGDIVRLLRLNIREVFEESDADRRRAAIKHLFVEDCLVHAPPGILKGWDALDRFAGELRESHPTFRYTIKGEPQALQDAGIVAWHSGPEDGLPVYSGLDVIIARESKIAVLYVFLNPELA